MKLKENLYRYVDFRGYVFYRIEYKQIAINRSNYDEISLIYDEIEKAGWNVDQVNRIKNKHKKYRERNSQNRFIYKTNENKYQIIYKNKGWGIFKNVEDAREERDLLEKYNWDIETVCALGE